MNNEQIKVFKKGCRHLFYGRVRSSVKETIALTSEEKIIFDKVMEAHIDGIRDESCRRLGIAGFEQETCKAVGEALGISRSRVSQLERRALPEVFRKVNSKWRTWIWE